MYNALVLPRNGFGWMKLLSQIKNAELFNFISAASWSDESEKSNICSICILIGSRMHKQLYPFRRMLFPNSPLGCRDNRFFDELSMIGKLLTRRLFSSSSKKHGETVEINQNSLDSVPYFSGFEWETFDFRILSVRKAAEEIKEHRTFYWKKNRFSQWKSLRIFFFRSSRKMLWSNSVF